MTLDILYKKLMEKNMNSNLLKDIKLITDLNDYNMINIENVNILIEEYDNIKAPSITCGIIVYNEENYIDRCISSITVNEFDEILILDSGSTDNTINIIQQKFPNVKLVYTNKILDLSKLRNTLLKSVTTDWICFIDADNCFVNLNVNKARRISKLIDFLKIKCVLSIPVIEYDNSITIDNRRMFSMKENLYYYGSSHGEPFYSNPVDGYVPFSIAVDIFINHDGYDPNIIDMVKKNKRAIRSTKEMKDLEPWNPKWMFFLGREMFSSRQNIDLVIETLEIGFSLYPSSKYKRYYIDTLMLLCYILKSYGYIDKLKIYQNILNKI